MVDNLFFTLMMFHYLCKCKIYAKINMKKIITSIMILCSAIMSAQTQPNKTYFPYPSVPENLTTLYDRSDYLIEHFWERCNLKSAFSYRDKFKQAFSDYVGIIPYANRDVVTKSVAELIKEVKKNPANMLTLGKIAEETLYSDSAVIWSDELYYPFAKAVAETKKIANEDKARFKYHAQVLSHSQIGMTAFELPYTNELGEQCNLKDIVSPITIIFINEYDCDDCMFAKARLSTNIKANELITEGTLNIVSLSPSEADEEWREAMSSYPDKWIKAATPEVESYFDIRMTPSIYILNNKREIVAKNINIDILLNYINKL